MAPLTTVTSSGILDGTIVNADLNASAAIALSKLASHPSVLTGSTSNTIPIVTGANALSGQANLQFNGSGDLTVIGNEGVSANLYLRADEGDDNGDGWRIGSNQDTNDLTFANNTSGSYVDKLTLLKTGEATFTGNITIPEKIIHSGDTDTFLEFGTNIISLDTAGSERLRIDDAGRVLIGTTSAVIASSAEFNEIVLSGKTKGAGITLQDVDANTRFQIRTDDDNSGDPMTLLNASTNHPISIRTNNTERLRIAADGTAKFSGSIEVDQGSNGKIDFGDITSGYGRLYADTSGTFVGSKSNHDLVLRTNNTERMRIDTSGRLIIGHSASLGEARAFQIIGTSATTASAQLIRQSADDSCPNLDFAKSRNATKGSNTIVQDGDALGQIVFRGDDGNDLNTSAATIFASAEGTLAANVMPGRLAFSTTSAGAASTTERMRIDSLGRLLIGDTTTAWNANSNGYKVSVKESSNENGAIRFLDTDSMVGGVAGIAKGANQIVSGTLNVDGVFGSTYNHTHLISGDGSDSANASIKLTVHTEGNVEILDGNLIVASGHGIDFSATSGTGDSELFDDYEEGNWTPVWTGSSGTMSNTYDHQSGIYTKIGRQVTVTCILNLTASSGGSSELRVTGLPFTVAGAEGFMGYCHFNAHPFTIDEDYIQFGAIAQSSTSYVHFRKWRYDTGNYAAQQYSSGAVSWCRFTITYAI